MWRPPDRALRTPTRSRRPASTSALSTANQLRGSKNFISARPVIFIEAAPRDFLDPKLR